MTSVINSLGVPQWYGPRTGAEGLPSGILEYGPERRLVLDFNYLQANTGLPVINGNKDASQLLIPKGALITSAILFVTTAFTSSGSAVLNLGTETPAGGTVDADGIDAIAVASLTAGAVIVCDGAQIGVANKDNALQLSVDDATATFTAGEARLVVTYIPFQV